MNVSNDDLPPLTEDARIQLHRRMAEGFRVDGWVYFITSDHAPDIVKIGWAETPASRLRSISLMSPVPLRIITAMVGSGVTEKGLHEKFKDFRAHGEWFRLEGPVKDYIWQRLEMAGPTPWLKPKSTQS